MLGALLVPCSITRREQVYLHQQGMHAHHMLPWHLASHRVASYRAPSSGPQWCQQASRHLS